MCSKVNTSNKDDYVCLDTHAANSAAPIAANTDGITVPSWNPKKLAMPTIPREINKATAFEHMTSLPSP
jgi:hypothetical protein